MIYFYYYKMLLLDLNTFQHNFLTFALNMAPRFNNTFNNVYVKISEFENMNGKSNWSFYNVIIFQTNRLIEIPIYNIKFSIYRR